MYTPLHCVQESNLRANNTDWGEDGHHSVTMSPLQEGSEIFSSGGKKQAMSKLSVNIHLLDALKRKSSVLPDIKALTVTKPDSQSEAVTAALLFLKKRNSSELHRLITASEKLLFGPLLKR